jgi:hypothetical protein
MLGQHASAARPSSFDAADTVTKTVDLRRQGWTPSSIKAQLTANRWQRQGRAVVRHNGPLTRAEERSVALVNCGPRSVLTSFTAAELLGLQGWSREGIHVLVPAGARLSPYLDDAVEVHYTGRWDLVRTAGPRPIQRLPAALVIAASSLTRARFAVGLLAAAIQQRRLRPDDLREALAANPSARHHAILSASVEDIAQGSHALSEIDFIRLCRRAQLPVPTRQAVRRHHGKRRYLDAEWDLEDGRRLVVEIDGALHLVPERWYADQLRQNEIVLSGSTVLRFPSVVVRTEPQLVVDQLRRALRP